MARASTAPRIPRRRAALALGVLLLAGAPAHAQEWVYTAREGDNLWSLAEEYLVSMHHWRAFRALNDVPEPRRMLPGTRVRFPARWLRVQPAPATLVAVSGDARVIDAASATSPATAGGSLGPGDRLVTGDGASAVVRFADGSTMLVRPRSEVAMDDLGLYGTGLMVDTRARLQRGGIELDVPPEPRNRLEIVTPSASALVRGTRLRVASEAARARAEVLAGAVRVASDAGRVDLAAGTGTVVRAGEAPAPARALLPAPELAGAPRRIERLQPRLRWAVLEGASGYRAQIATTGAAPVLLLDAAVTTPALQLPDLPDGAYELRVRGVDALGLEGRTARATLTLDARPEPPATLEPRPDATVRSTQPTLRWARPATADAFRVQIAADAGFTRLLVDRADLGAPELALEEALAPGTVHWRVATVDTAGEQGPFGDGVAFTVRPAPPAPGAADVSPQDDGLALRWSPAQPGQSFEVEVAAAQDFAADTTLHAVAGPALALPAPERDVWFRVRIVDVDGYRGPWGTPQHVEAPPAQPWWLLALPLLLLL